MVFLAAAPSLPQACQSGNFLFLPHWWEFLPPARFTTDPTLGDCNINFIFPGDILTVGLAVLDMLLRIAGFVAVISIIIAGFQYQFTMGDIQKAAAARRRIYNSLIGLAIALIATATVSFIGKSLAK